MVPGGVTGVKPRCCEFVPQRLQQRLAPGLDPLDSQPAEVGQRRVQRHEARRRPAAHLVGGRGTRAELPGKRRAPGESDGRKWVTMSGDE